MWKGVEEDVKNEINFLGVIVNLAAAMFFGFASTLVGRFYYQLANPNYFFSISFLAMIFCSYATLFFATEFMKESSRWDVQNVIV